MLEVCRCVQPLQIREASPHVVRADAAVLTLSEERACKPLDELPQAYLEAAHALGDDVTVAPLQLRPEDCHGPLFLLSQEILEEAVGQLHLGERPMNPAGQVWASEDVGKPLLVGVLLYPSEPFLFALQVSVDLLLKLTELALEALHRPGRNGSSWLKSISLPLKSIIIEMACAH